MADISAMACHCCADMIAHKFGRRRFLVAGGASLAFAPIVGANAAEGNYDAMLLTCIDPRFPEHSLNWMRRRDLSGKYSQFSIAGAAIGVVAPAFADWQKAFWDNLGASMQLHRIPRVIAVNHRDCGAAKIAYGAERVGNAAAETDTHKAALAEFRAAVAKRQPTLKVETALMSLDGSVEVFT